MSTFRLVAVMHSSREFVQQAGPIQPDIPVLDEAFSVLDTFTSSPMRNSLMEIKDQINDTLIMVVQELEERAVLSVRIEMLTNVPKATVGGIL